MSPMYRHLLPTTTVTCMLAAAGALLVTDAFAQATSQPAQQVRPAPTAAATPPASAVAGASKGIEYLLPTRGAPKTRVGAAVRGDDKDAAKVVLWAPEHTGQTTMAQPVLYWWVDRPARANIEITVVDDNQVEPVALKTLPGISAAGVQAIDLASLGTTLKENVTYRWFVSVIVDPARRSNDVLVGGTIVRVPASNAITIEDPLARAQAQARAGLWFDAVHTLQQATKQPATSTAAQSMLEALLVQGTVQK